MSNRQSTILIGLGVPVPNAPLRVAGALRPAASMPAASLLRSCQGFVSNRCSEYHSALNNNLMP